VHHPPNIAAQHARTFGDALIDLARSTILSFSEETRIVKTKNEFTGAMLNEAAPALFLDARSGCGKVSHPPSAKRCEGWDARKRRKLSGSRPAAAGLNRAFLSPSRTSAASGDLICRTGQ